MFNFIAIPFGWVLKFIYELVQSYGLAIIIFTIFTKVIMYPLMLKSKKSMRKMTKVQPKMQELQKKYKNDKVKYQQEMAKLYEQEKINPAGSCLPTLITLPIMLGLYYVIQQPLTYLMGLDPTQIGEIAKILEIELLSLRESEITIANAIYNNFDAVAHISPNIFPIDFNFFGFNLALTPSIKDFSILLLIPVLSGVTSFASMMVSQKMQGTSLEGQPQSMKMMLYMMPFMSAYFGLILPAGIGIYWIMGNLLMIVQEFVMNAYFKKHDKKTEYEAQEVREREERNKRKEIEIRKEEQRRISKEMNDKK